MGYIYCITNTVTNRVYIGKSIRAVKERVHEHFTDYELMTTDTKLTRAILKYGKNVWNWKIIEECDDNILSQREAYWISEYNSYRDGYNSTLGGDGCPRYEFDKQDIFKRYTNGESAKSIASNYGCHYHYIHEVLWEFGVDTSLRKGSPKPIACFDRDKNLIEIFKHKSEIQEYLVKYGYGKSLGNVAHFISKACKSGKMTYKRYWVELNESNIESISKLDKDGISEFNTETRLSTNLYFCANIGNRLYHFKKIGSLAKYLSNGEVNYPLQYRLKRAYEEGRRYKNILIVQSSEAEYDKSINKLD
ncbi:MAG: GIY-YIG nuclease family protein [Lachnospiraceae bacterium]|nr:GIY-YIG nuclease family protein [Lachnospiraceae bacterium]